MRTIVLNQSNVVQDGNNNTLIYRFPVNANFKDNYVAVSSLTMFYSWFNISASLGNNKLSFNWVNANNTNAYTTYTVSIPDGLYEIESINNYLKWVMFNAPSLTTNQISPVPASPFYLINGSGDQVYYFELVVNVNSYGIQLNTYNVPAFGALPSGFTNPGNTLLPTQTFNPVVTFTAKFNDLVGFTAGFATAQNQNNSTPNPATTSAYKIGSTLSYLSSKSPQIQPNSTLLLTMSNIENPWSSPSSVLYAVTPSVAISKAIIEKPPEYSWQKLTDGNYSQLRLQFTAADGSSIAIRDPNICILLVIK